MITKHTAVSSASSVPQPLSYSEERALIRALDSVFAENLQAHRLRKAQRQTEMLSARGAA